MGKGDLTLNEAGWQIKYFSEYGIVYRNAWNYRWRFVTLVPLGHPLRKKRKVLMETEASAMEWEKHYRYDVEEEKLYQFDGSWPIIGVVLMDAQIISLAIRTDKVMLERRKKIISY